ncbi:MAG TPA: ABC transporter permease subunit [Solirubrobacterales bacterium]
MATELVREAILGRRRSLLWWSVGLVALVVLTVAFFPSVRDSTALNSYAEDLPEAMRGLFTGGETDLVSGPGYLNSQLFALMAPLLVVIFAIGYGASAVAGEEEKGMLELVLAQPVSRAKLVWARFAALAALVAGISIALLVAVAVSSAVVDIEVGLDKLVAATGGVALLGLLYGSVAIAAGSVWPGRGRAIAVASAVAVAAWMLDGLGQAVDWLDPWRPLSPVYQVISSNPLREGVPWDGWLILTAASLALIAIAALGLGRRDVEQ